jgi:hypothetical protein
MPIIIDHVPVNQPSGSRTYGPANVSNAVSDITIRIARCTTATPTFWPNDTTTLAVTIEVSVNGGAFQFCCGFESFGGINIGKGGQEATESVVQCSMPGGINRQARATVVVTGGPLVSQLTVETS